jgi:Ca-activated chloride channel family protein
VGTPVPRAKVDKLKYQTPAAPTGEGATDLMTVKVRYKAPTGDASKLISHVVRNATASLEKTSVDFRWAMAVAGFGMLLRESPERGTLSWPSVLMLAKSSLGKDEDGYRREMLELVEISMKKIRK